MRPQPLAPPVELPMGLETSEGCAEMGEADMRPQPLSFRWSPLCATKRVPRWGWWPTWGRSHLSL